MATERLIEKLRNMAEWPRGINPDEKKVLLDAAMELYFIEGKLLENARLREAATKAAFKAGFEEGTRFASRPKEDPSESAYQEWKRRAELVERNRAMDAGRES